VLARGGRSGLAADGAPELTGDGRSGLRLHSGVNPESLGSNVKIVNLHSARAGWELAGDV